MTEDQNGSTIECDTQKEDKLSVKQVKDEFKETDGFVPDINDHDKWRKYFDF